ncbi:MAG: copper resistance system multicopper oxidase [Hydrogenovibrio crunogenus]|uniref:Copper-resistance protein CopA n=1 Tax=Hydrogenovibrio crunogenus (strain DSM 25203 / XCL-2) TaxID=317025 RepID=Q31DR8_HYDCU|nr:copper resistance system multicopper oxidase [Hydrogenovibrio crunogenus]
MNTSNKSVQPQLGRRQFVKGIALSTISAAIGSHLPSAWAKEEFSAIGAGNLNPKQPVLIGPEFDLTISETPVNITGSPVKATLINNSLPAPTLVWREGETVTIRVKNTLSVDTSIHWHGIILPFQMDGVPGLSYDGIKPGETFTYQFTVQQHGTYWYHSHSEFQEQTGLYGALVILPKKADPLDYDHDFVIQLSDWSDSAPDTLYSNIKKMGDYYNYSQRTVGDFWHEVKTYGFSKAWEKRKMWNQMRMTDRDLSDVTGATYTYLMNGLSPKAHWRTVIESGKKVRLRFVNSSAMTFFDVRIPGLKMTVVAADGNLVQPVEIDEFRIGVAETYDVIVEPDTSKQAYAIFAQAIDRSGFAMGSITSDPTQLADSPEMDPLPILSMTDMGMEMDMGSTSHPMNMDGEMEGMNPSSQPMNMNTDSQRMTPSDHNSMNGTKHDMSSMQQQDYGHALAMEKSQMGKDVSNVDHSKHSHGMENMNVNLDDITIPMDMNPQLPQIKTPSAEGAQIGMRAMAPQYRLDDPGVGLRENGRKVLTYADLKNRFPTRHHPKPTKELVMHLTGNMERYMWSINGIPFEEAEPLNFQYGDRVRITFINDTMMNHPMHLHGVWSDLETGDENHIPRKHTVIVQPGSKISYRVTMDAKGDWAYHCHLLYHMMGMFRKVQIR